MQTFQTIQEAEQHLVSQFDWLEDWQQKYAYIIDLGKALPELPADLMTDAHLVRGCQAQVWMVADIEGGRFGLQATSDARIVQGLIAIMCLLYQDRTLAAIQAYDHGFADRLGLRSHLSPTRANGLNHMLAFIRQQAMVA